MKATDTLPAEPTELTERQAAIVAFLRDYLAANGVPPSVREIGDHVGLASTASVHHQLRRLEELGWLARPVPRRSRGSVLIEPAGEAA